MSQFNLDGRKFSPYDNSEYGRVKNDAVFSYRHIGNRFEAVYTGAGFSNGHLIGIMTGDNQADLIYHCRADEDDSLEAGEAKASFTKNENGKIIISMQWQWLNGSRASGTSHYIEITDDL